MIKEGKKIDIKNINTKLCACITTLKKDRDIVCFFAFGSLVHGRLKPLSDLDLAILLSYRLNRSERFKKHIDMIGTLSEIFQTEEIDIILMNDAPLRFSYNILKKGKLLFCKDEKQLINFRHRVIMQYLDFKFFRDNFDRQFLTGIGYHG